ncbi:MAG: integrase arm-type DNA-binding domain-containing protein, partial [Marinomonas sp.]
MASLNKLTVKRIQTLKAVNGKSIRKSDGGGLFKPNNLKFWEFRYTRPVTGKKTFIGIGSFSDVTLSEARDKAYEMRKLLHEGIDPQIERVERKAKLKLLQTYTLKYVADQWHELKITQVKSKTMLDNWRKLEKYAFHKLGDIPVKSLNAPVVIEVLREPESIGKLETVKRTAQLLNEIMNFAVNSGFIDHNPLSGIRDVFKKPVVEHMKSLRPHEVSDLMRALGHANLYVVTRYLIEWQLHTMTRPSEAAGTRWDEIDFESKVWVIPDSRMKMKREHRIPLTNETLSILEGLKVLTSNSPYVFPSTRSNSRHV